MNFCNKKEAIRKMNRYGKTGSPFFFLISFDASKCLVLPPSEVPEAELCYDFRGVSNAGKGEFSRLSKKIRWETCPEPFEIYQKSFEKVQQNLYAGNSFLVNLTCATPVRTNLSLEEVFALSDARYKLLLKHRFVCFSPETFVRIQNGCVYSYPMKGTIDASIPNARNILLQDEKEAAEHATITDLIRNDLSRISTDVTVVRYKYIDELHTHRGALLQMSSEIRGKLPDDYRNHLGDMFFSLLPAGSITGAPKKKTVEIIRQAETYRRDFYTGVAGFFDGTDLDSAVLIRFLELESDGSMLFKSGGGITFRSDARSEYEEMKEKVYVPIS